MFVLSMYIYAMKFLSISVSLLIILYANHFQSLHAKKIANIKHDLDIEEDMYKTSIQRDSRKSANSSLFALNPIILLLNQFVKYMENDYEPIKISLYQIPISNISHRSGTNSAMHFQNMRFLERNFNNDSIFREQISHFANQPPYEILIGLDHWPMEFAGSIIIEQSETNRTMNFSMPFIFSAFHYDVYTLSKSYERSFSTKSIFGIMDNSLSVQIEPISFENDSKLVQDIKTYGLLNFQYLKRRINLILTTAIIKRTPHYSLPPLPNQTSDTDPYYLFHTSHNISSNISLDGVQKIRNVILQSNALKLPGKVTYSVTITTKKIIGKVKWNSDYYNKIIPEEKREFSLSAKYIKVIMTTELNSIEENLEIEISPLTVNIPREQFQINDQVQNYLNFLKDNLKQIITESLQKSFLEQYNQQDRK